MGEGGVVGQRDYGRRLTHTQLAALAITNSIPQAGYLSSVYYVGFTNPCAFTPQ